MRSPRKPETSILCSVFQVMGRKYDLKIHTMPVAYPRINCFYPILYHSYVKPPHATACTGSMGNLLAESGYFGYRLSKYLLLAAIHCHVVVPKFLQALQHRCFDTLPLFGYNLCICIQGGHLQWFTTKVVQQH